MTTTTDALGWPAAPQAIAYGGHSGAPCARRASDVHRIAPEVLGRRFGRSPPRTAVLDDALPAALPEA